MSRRNREGRAPKAKPEGQRPPQKTPEPELAAEQEAAGPKPTAESGKPTAAGETPRKGPRPGRVDCKVLKTMLHGGKAWFAGDTVPLPEAEVEKRRKRGEIE